MLPEAGIPRDSVRSPHNSPHRVRSGPFCCSPLRSVGPAPSLPSPSQITTSICAPRPGDLHPVFAPAMLRSVISGAKIGPDSGRSPHNSSHRVRSGPICHSPRRSVGPAPSLPTPRRSTTGICAPRPGNTHSAFTPATLQIVISETGLPQDSSRSLFDSSHRVHPGPFCRNPPRSVGPAPSLPTPCQRTTRICAPRPNNLHFVFASATLHSVVSGLEIRLGSAQSLFNSLHRVRPGPCYRSRLRPVGPAPSLPTPWQRTTRIRAPRPNGPHCVFALAMLHFAMSGAKIRLDSVRSIFDSSHRVRPGPCYRSRLRPAGPAPSLRSRDKGPQESARSGPTILTLSSLRPCCIPWSRGPKYD